MKWRWYYTIAAIPFAYWLLFNLAVYVANWGPEMKPPEPYEEPLTGDERIPTFDQLQAGTNTTANMCLQANGPTVSWGSCSSIGGSRESP